MTHAGAVRTWRAAAFAILIWASFAFGGCGEQPAGSGPRDGGAAASPGENGEAQAETGALSEELSTDAELLDMQATRVEESEIPLITGGTRAKEEQVSEMSAALEDLRGASEEYVEEDDPFCTELPNLPTDNTKQEPPSVAVSDIEQLRGQIGDARGPRGPRRGEPQRPRRRRSGGSKGGGGRVARTGRGGRRGRQRGPRRVGPHGGVGEG